MFKNHTGQLEGENALARRTGRRKKLGPGAVDRIYPMSLPSARNGIISDSTTRELGKPRSEFEPGLSVLGATSCKHHTVWSSYGKHGSAHDS